MKRTNNSGFTLLEIIIVIIIIGVLASLALPRLFSTVEFSRSSEAMANFTSVRSAMERCKMRKGTYIGCTATWNNLDIPDPGDSPGSHFSYSFSNISAEGYTVTAHRNTIDGGSVTSTISLEMETKNIIKSGSGAFNDIGK